MAVKKQWYEIVSPKIFGGGIIGETPAVEPRHLLGRKIEVSLAELTNEYSKFYMKMVLEVHDVQGSKAYTKLVGHDIMRERVYRMVQRYGRRVDVVQDITTKDGYKVRVKTVFVLIKRVGTSMKDATRRAARARMEEIVKDVTFEELVEMIAKGNLAHDVKKAATKAYPVASLEIRKTEVLEEPKMKVTA